MSDIILHHYPASPFAEKARLMLGFKGLAWRSVTIPRWMPKPDLMPLTGGYRRTPVMQIGADIYCDTACIARELERRQPAPSLFPVHAHGSATMLGAWADRTLFFDVVPVVFGTHAASVPAELREDRYRFSEGAIDLARYAADQPHLRAQLRTHLWWLEHAFDDGRPYVLGAEPTYADFCLWGPMWMAANRVADLGLLADKPRIGDWLARMGAIGHGSPEPLEAADALEIARAAQPAPVVNHHPDLPEGLSPGDAVTVAPDDYGKDPVAGRLLACSAGRIVIARTDPRVGEVHVHFPRAGYRLAAAQE